MKIERWEYLKRWVIKPYFEKMGINSCELRFDGCQNFFLTFAHSRRRRKIETYEQEIEVVLACVRCHSVLDNQSIFTQEQAEAKVKEVISNRLDNHNS